MTTASIFTDFWDNRIAEHDAQGLFLVLVGFILSFAFIRMSTRLMRSPRVPWWPGSIVSDSGVHLHHLVFGIVTMMVAGAGRLRRLRQQPLDRDLRLRLRHRRRADDRRVRPLGLPRRRLLGRGGPQLDRRDRDRRRAMLLVAARLHPVHDRRRLGRRRSSAPSSAPSSSSLLVAICFAKGRVLHGMHRLLRLPDRPLRRLPPRQAATRPGRGAATASGSPKKQARAEERFPPDRRTERFKNAFRDIVGGKPSEGLAAAQEEAFAATREASEEVRAAGRTDHPPGRRQGRLSLGSTIAQP